MMIKYSKDKLFTHLNKKIMNFLYSIWDPDFTKVTPEEAQRISNAEKSGFINDEDIDWDNLDIIV